MSEANNRPISESSTNLVTLPFGYFVSISLARTPWLSGKHLSGSFCALAAAAGVVLEAASVLILAGVVIVVVVVVVLGSLRFWKYFHQIE
jgi:hypothetical protein